MHVTVQFRRSSIPQKTDDRSIGQRVAETYGQCNTAACVGADLIGLKAGGRDQGIDNRPLTTRRSRRTTVTYDRNGRASALRSPQPQSEWIEATQSKYSKDAIRTLTKGCLFLFVRLYLCMTRDSRILPFGRRRPNTKKEQARVFPLLDR